MRVALISPCGLGNLGDALIQDTYILRLRERLGRHVDFCGVTLNPEDTRSRHGVAAFPLCSWNSASPEQAESPGTGQQGRRSRFRRLGFAGRELRHIGRGLRLLRGMKLVLVAGGGQLDEEWGGAKAHPWALLKWAVAARAQGCPVAISCVGAGSLDNPWSARLVRGALRLATHRSFRDSRTIEVVEGLGVRGPHRLLPDAAFGFPTEPAVGGGGGRTVVGMSPIAFRRPGTWWPENDPGSYENHVAGCALVAARLAAQGLEVRIFTTDAMDEGTARDVASQARDAAGAAGSSIKLLHTREVSQLIGHVASMDAVIASRLHAVIVAQLLARPVLAVSYNWKVDLQMVDAGLGDFVVPILSFSPEDVVARMDAMLSQQASISERLETLRQAKAATLADEFDRLADLAGGSSATGPAPASRSHSG